MGETYNFIRNDLSLLAYTQSTATGQKFFYSVKELDPKFSSKQKSDIENELKISNRLPQHPNIKILRKVLPGKENNFLLYDPTPSVFLNDSVDLLTYISKTGPLPEKVAFHIFSQVLSGVNFLHLNGIIHRDIKLPNILIGKNNNIALTGFQHSEIINNQQLMINRKGSPAYLSPQILNGNPYSGQSADVWSLGIVLYAMLCGCYPFEGSDPKTLFQKILNFEPQYPDHLSFAAKSLLYQIFKKLEHERISIERIISHEWCSQFLGCSKTPSFVKICKPKYQYFSCSDDDSFHQEIEEDQTVPVWCEL